MKRIRSRVLLLACWLGLFYNIDRMFEPLKIGSLPYAFVLAMVVIPLIAPRIAQISLWVILLAPIPVFLGVKAWMGLLAVPSAFPITVIEICAITITSILSHWLSMALNEFESAVAHITIGYQDKMAEPASTGQSSIYREVRRARNHHRPLALLAVSVEEKSIKVALDRMVREAQLAMMKQYTMSDVSQILCRELEDCSIVVQDNDHFLVVLPETTPKEIPILVDRLRKKMTENIGVELKIGTASLLNDSFTFEGLVDKATKDMEAKEMSSLAVDLEQFSMDQRMP